jgi:septum site-determining protein MinD
MTLFLAVVSAKGGVGKTTTTINLAHALAEFGRTVIAVDTDITAPNLSIHLGITKYPKTLHHVLHGEASIHDIIYKHQSGIQVIPGSVAYDHVTTAPINQMRNVIPNLKGKSEIVILDSAPGLGEEAQTTIALCDYAIVVVTPDLAAVSDARKTVKLIKQLNRKILGVVLNRAHAGDELSKTEVETFLEIPVLGTIPDDFHIRSAYKIKCPVVFAHPDAPSTVQYKKLAAKIIGEKYENIVPSKKQASMMEYIKQGLLG